MGSLRLSDLGKPLVCADFRPHTHKHRTHFHSVQRTHLHPSFCARTRTHTLTFFLKKSQKFFYLIIEKNMLKIFLNFFFSKKVRTCAKVIYARTHTHICKNFPAPICTKIVASARVRARAHTFTLKVWIWVMEKELAVVKLVSIANFNTNS